MQRIDGQNIFVRVPNTTLAEVDRMAKRLGLTRSEMVRNMLDSGCSILRAYEGAGVVKAMDVFRRAEKAFRETVGQQSLFSGMK